MIFIYHYLFFEINRDYYDNKRKEINENIENYDKKEELELYYKKKWRLLFFKELESLKDIRAFLKLVNENIDKIKTKLTEKEKNIKNIMKMELNIMINFLNP